MFSKVRRKVIGFLKQGITPEKLALSFAFGICLGIIPVLGTTTVLCLLAALIFRFNIAVSQIVMHLVYPLQLILFIPFLKYGAEIFTDEQLNYTFSEIGTMLQHDTWKTVKELFWINMSGLLLWLIVSPFIFLAVYFFCKFGFTHLALKIKTVKGNS